MLTKRKIFSRSLTSWRRVPVGVVEAVFAMTRPASAIMVTQESDSLMQIRIVWIFPCDQFERSFVASAWLNNERIIIDNYRYIKYEDKN